MSIAYEIQLWKYDNHLLQNHINEGLDRMVLERNVPFEIIRYQTANTFWLQKIYKTGYIHIFILVERTWDVILHSKDLHNPP